VDQPIACCADRWLRAIGLVDHVCACRSTAQISTVPRRSGRPVEDSHRVAQSLGAALACCGMRPRPASKFGFAIDCGNQTCADGDTSAISASNGSAAGLILPCGRGPRWARQVTVDTAVRCRTRAARMVSEHGGVTDGRGAWRTYRHARRTRAADTPPLPAVAPQNECDRPWATLIGFAFWPEPRQISFCAARQTLGPAAADAWRMV